MDEALAGAHPPALAKPNRDEYGDEGRRWLSVPELHLTAGAGEVHVRHPGGRWRVAPPPVRELNPIGSGDCYLAALAHARLAKWPLADQLAFAAAAGAANAEQGGVARIGLREIEALRDRSAVRPAAENE
jgi:fructose-1-phosphate kinase PfkB-like protein